MKDPNSEVVGGIRTLATVIAFLTRLRSALDGARPIHRHGGLAIAVLVMLLLSPGALSEQYRLPLLPSASDPLRQGTVRIVNHSAESGGVAITAIDDAGLIYGPVTLNIKAQQAIEFSASDLEQGNAGKGDRGGHR